MSSSDDPEERIRELERSLSDRTAELTQSSTETGSAQYGSGYAYASGLPPQAPYPPPPAYGAPPSYSAPPSYGVPFPPAPMASGAGANRGWIVVGVLTMITIGLVAGAVAFFSSVFSSVTSVFDVPSNSRTVSGGGGPFGVPPSRSGANRPQSTVGAPTTSSAPPGGDVSVSGVGDNKTIECYDGIVSISGVSNTVVLTGHCTSVTVSGVQNVITIDAADTISASGFDNRVTYRSGSPTIQNSGDSNVVEQR